MKQLALSAAFLLVAVCGCPRPVPTPPMAPPAATCGLDAATHDSALNDAATTLQERGDVAPELERLVGHAAVVCVVRELAADELSAAPKLAATARHWLDAESAR